MNIEEIAKRIAELHYPNKPNAIIDEPYRQVRMETLRKQVETELKNCSIPAVIERFSGENLMKLQKHFVSLYGSDEMAKEKANSFAVGFGKACELMIKELNAL